MRDKVLKLKRTILLIFIVSVAKVSTFKELSHNADADSSLDPIEGPGYNDQSIHNGKIMLLGEGKLLSQVTGIQKQLNRVYTKSSSKNDETAQLNGVVDDDIVVLGDHSDVDTYKKLKRFKHKQKHLWELQNYKDARKEPGFDLTPEEIQKFKIWENGVVPYYIDLISFDKVFRDKIRRFLQMTNAATSLNFVELPSPPANDDERWVFFINRRGLLQCADHTVNNFTNRGVQQVILGYDCAATKGEIAEAVMSIAGVPAQHNAPDRDNYIKVNMENIMPDKQILFEKLKDDEWLFHDLKYDFDSITHYDVHKYSPKGHVTIEPKDDSKDFEPAKSYSSTDLLKLKMLYNYISRTKKLQQTKCQKLYRGSNKFERIVPNNMLENPRKKPSRYTGLPDGEEKSNDNKYAELEDKESDVDLPENEKDEDSNKPYGGNDEEEQTTDVSVGEDEEYVENKKLMKGKTDHALSDNNYNNLAKIKKLKGSQPKIYKKESLSISKVHKNVKLKSPKSTNRQKRDPLYLLSDYQTGEETDRKKVLKQIQAKTMLSYSGK